MIKLSSKFEFQSRYQKTNVLIWLKNFPIPPFHLGLLVGGIALHFWPTSAIEFSTGVGSAIVGWLCAVAFAVVAAWSTVSFGEDTIEQPTRLRVDGPYRFSRNPMYVAWILLVVGVGLLIGSWWLLVAALLAAVATHFVDIPREEAFLRDRFGSEYEGYCSRVRKWI